MNETNEPVDHPIMGFLVHKGHEMLPRGNVEEMRVLFEKSIERHLKKINNISSSSFKLIHLHENGKLFTLFAFIHLA